MNDKIINLDKYFKNYKDGLDKKIFDRNEKHGPSSKYFGTFFLKGNNHNYFFKLSNGDKITYQMYAELLSEELASLCNLKIINTRIAIINIAPSGIARYKYCLLSDDYRKEGFEIYSSKDIILDYLKALESKNQLYEVIGYNSLEEVEYDKYNIFNNLELLWDAYLYHYKDFDNCHDIVYAKVNEQVKRYLFRFIVMDKDYHLSNNEELDDYNSKITYMAPLYDLDEAFADDFFFKNNSMRVEFNTEKDAYKDFEYFLRVSSEEYVELANNIYEVINIDAIKTSFDIIAKNKGIIFPEEVKEKMIKIYEEHYNKVGKILDEYTKVR